MRCQYTIDKFKIIEEAINKSANASLVSPDISSMLSSYLVVFISGVYEDVIEYLFIQRAGKSNDKEIENFVKVIIDKQFRNPNYDNIRELIKGLDSKYQAILESRIDIKNKDGINSIVNNKNSIAHGRISNTTINDVATYHNSAIKIFEELENILL